MRRGVFVLMGLLLVALAACQSPQVTVSDVAHLEPKAINLSNATAVVATVNGESLTVADVVSSAVRYGVTPTTTNFGQLLDGLIVARIATQNAPPIDNATLDTRIDDIRGNLTVDQLNAVLASQGLSVNLVRERIREELAMNELFNDSVVGPPDTQIRDYYATHAASFVQPERVVIRQFFVSNSTHNLTQQQALLQGYVDTNASTLCSYIGNYSDDRGSAATCGLIAVTRGSVIPELEYGAYGTPPGSTRVVTSRYGTHVITGIGVIPMKAENLTTATPQIRQILETQERTKLAQRKVSGLLKNANITVYYAPQK